MRIPINAKPFHDLSATILTYANPKRDEEETVEVVKSIVSDKINACISLMNQFNSMKQPGNCWFNSDVGSTVVYVKEALVNLKLYLVDNVSVDESSHGGTKAGYVFTKVKITFTPNGTKVSRIVFVNSRGTKYVKHAGAMVLVSKLKNVVYQ